MSAGELKQELQTKLEQTLGAIPGTGKISNTFAAYLLCQDLMAGEGGYSAENAALAAMEMFPEANEQELYSNLGIKKEGS